MKLFQRSITFNEKEFKAEIARIEKLVAELRGTLEEALDWIERPVADPNDVPLFEDFERRAHKLISIS